MAEPKPKTAKDTTEAEIKERYDKGENLYTIAREVYGFESDEVVSRVKSVLGILQDPEEKLAEG